MKPRPGAGARLQRLLSLVPWVAARDGPSIDEICARFDLTRDALLSDLDTVFMVGIHPFTPDELIDVTIARGRVWIRFADVFSRPLRLTWGEGLVLVTAGTSLLAAPGADPTGPLARGLAKVAAAIGVDPARAIDVTLGPAPGPLYDTLRAAVRDHQPVEIDYYSYGRDEHGTRTIEPWRVFADQGQWYAAGHCRQAGGERIFRLDRVAEARPVEGPFEAPIADPEPGLDGFGTDQPRVTLDLEPAGAWVAEAYPVDEAVDLGDGRRRVTLAVTARPWLERVLLRLGADATVVAVDDRLGGTDIAARAALRVRERYEIHRAPR